MSNGSKVLIYLSFLLKEVVFQLLLQLQPNIWLLCIFIYKNQKLSFSHFIPTQDQNQPKAGFGPSGFIIFCQLKNLCTYQDISFNHHIGGGLQHKNMCKILQSLAVLFLAARKLFSCQTRNGGKELRFFLLKITYGGGLQHKNMYQILQSLDVFSWLLEIFFHTKQQTTNGGKELVFFSF